MNKTILLLIIIIGFLSCNNTVETTHTMKEAIINNTSYKLLYTIITDVRADTIFSNGNDSLSVQFTKTGTCDLPLIGAYKIDIQRVKIISRSIYNLNDTTSYTCSYGKVVLPEDSIFYSNIQFIESGETYDVVDFEKLIFSNNLFLIMKKDYTMPDKFKEYYKK